MTVLKVLWHMIAALAVIVVAVAGSCRYLEQPRSRFATYTEAESAGMFEAGWLPSYLPRSSTDIDESHDIDTNDVWASFKYAPGDTKTIQDNCKVLAKAPSGTKYLCPPFEKQTMTVILKTDGSAWLESHANEI